jgi:hypothetical protein
MTGTIDARIYTSTDTRDVTRLRLQLRESGYSPIPLRGKNPAMRKDWSWTELHGATREQMDMWGTVFVDAVNTGLLTKLTPAIDIDIYVPEAAIAVEELARQYFADSGTFITRIGLPPKRAILLATDTPFKKITNNYISPDGYEQLLEVLADGQQLAAFGIHPDTHKLYVWVWPAPGTSVISCPISPARKRRSTSEANGLSKSPSSAPTAALLLIILRSSLFARSSAIARRGAVAKSTSRGSASSSAARTRISTCGTRRGIAAIGRSRSATLI